MERDAVDGFLSGKILSRVLADSDVKNTERHTLIQCPKCKKELYFDDEKNKWFCKSCKYTHKK